ncbi:MAG: patatin-like phospholipase family protein, partial [Rhodanobacter sp.]
IGTLRGLIGDTLIEELPLAFTAVATDLDRGREVWLRRGSLFDAIRASIAVPTVFRPHHIKGHRMVDGALLNPVPVTPLIGIEADYLLAISIDGAAETITAPAPVEHAPVDEASYRHRIGEFIGRLVPHGENTPREPGTLDTLNQAMDLMQANLARLRLAAYEPDLLIELPRNIASVYEFYRARELIERGRAQTRKALAEWPRSGTPVRS